MRYKVYDITGGRYITDDSDLILKPDGRIARNEYGDEVGIQNCAVLFYPTDSDDYYIDEVGGTHSVGLSCAPNGFCCGNCHNISCKTCSMWVEPVGGDQ